MPEEINRVVTDSLASLLFTTSRDANENLERKGIDPSKIHYVGNVMIDTLLRHRQKAACLKIDKPNQYALVTLHRPSNVDDRNVLGPILEALEIISKSIPVLFRIHPRTAKRIREFGFCLNSLRVMDPLGYLEFLNLESTATIVLTDSGGLQEKTTILGVPCLTLRHNTERPVTISDGTNIMVGPNKDRILDAFSEIMDGDWTPKGPPEYWDGRAAERIVHVLRESSLHQWDPCQLSKSLLNTVRTAGGRVRTHASTSEATSCSSEKCRDRITGVLRVSESGCSG